MTQLETLKLWLPEYAEKEDLLQSALDRAEQVVLSLRFPFGYGPEQYLEPQYMGLQVEMAVELISKMGAEGETAHSENGVSRSYENAGISDSLKRRVVPMGKAVIMDAESEA